MYRKEKKQYSPAKKAAVAGLMAALTLALAFIERMLCAALPCPGKTHERNLKRMTY